MENSLYVYHHLGLGDHIVCNGMVRELCRGNDKVHLFCKHRNIVPVSFMYRDLPNLELIPVTEWEECVKFYENHDVRSLKTGGQGEGWVDDGRSFDRIFYDQAGMEHGKRWSSFHVERDMKRELALFRRFGLVENNYIFVHDDKRRGMRIRDSYIMNKPNLMRPLKGLTRNIFDYTYILENAREIHCIDSSFRLLADSIETRANLFFHFYARPINLNLETPSTKHNWTRLG